MFKHKLALTLAALLLSPAADLMAADHLDAPALQVANVGDRDINDLYAFQSPTNPDNTVLIMTVNPLAGSANPFFPDAMSGTTFGTDVTYELNIDNDNDQVADVTYSTTFGAASGGVQSFTVSDGSSTVASGNTGAIASAGGVTATAGLFDDPFFFDFVGFLNGFDFVNGDTFAGANVNAIVLEVPSSAINGADSNVGVWARTVVGGTQVDRVGRPAISTALIGSGRKDDFNNGDPTTDVANFDAELRTAISGLGGDPELAAILLPDVLTFDTSNPAGFLNGRGLADDVIDAELTLLTGSATTVSDNVDGNNLPFRDVFPYLADPIPEPSSIALAIFALTALGMGNRRRLV